MTEAPEAGGGGAGIFGLLCYLAIAVLFIAALWRIFSKADQPGWAAIIPIYNIYVLLKTVGRPGWWVILYLIPLVNLIVSIVVSIDLAKSFGKGGAFGFFMLWLLSIIGYPMLGFGGARYVGPAAAPA